jgi:transcriptional regulator with XRE-family HTH domain
MFIRSIFEEPMVIKKQTPAEVLVGCKLRELRNRKGLSLRALADRSGLNVNTLSLVENGKSSPSVSTLQQLALALKVPIANFFESEPLEKRVVSTPADQRPQAAFGSGIGAVHVWAQRRDVPTAEAQFLGAGALGGVRPDVAAVFGPQFGTAFTTTGFSLTTDRLEPGEYAITAYVWNRRTARWEDARTVAVTVR